MAYNNRLTSLKGAPRRIGKNFTCSNNQLKNLQYGPERVQQQYHCNRNLLETLDFTPEYAGEIFNFKENAALSRYFGMSLLAIKTQIEKTHLNHNIPTPAKLAQKHKI